MDTLHSNIDRYMEYCRYRRHLDSKTLKSYRADLAQYELFCSEASDYSARDTVDQFITQLHRQYKPKTIKRKIASLKAFFHYLQYKEMLSADPFIGLDIRFREPRLLPKTIPFHTIQTFLTTLYSQKEKAVSEYQKNCCIRDIAVIELLFATGVRISELCSLQPTDIDLQSNTVLIYGKGARERILQVGNSDVVSALTLYQEAFQKDIAACGYFFVNRQHHKLSDQSVRFMINRYADLAGISQHITPHMFRHSFATLLLEQDVDIRYIQRMLGHSSISTTEIYTHVSNTKQKDILLNRHPRNIMSIGEHEKDTAAKQSASVMHGHQA
ncbi:MAG: tyrosine-type recombinase/integrase [Roseburia sp.]|nr:tyrosine-type recombinase/integrase [Roseburia sp.]MCM1096715.1 tyrosine-type recombinase/integrase [Ruminococcus flavefaciens]